MEKNRRDPISGEWDDPLGDWANGVPADPPADRSDSICGAEGGNRASKPAADTPRDSSVDSEDERVGYGRPPRKYQYRKGQSSPNPSGRPKGSKNLSTIIKEVLLDRKIEVRDRGRLKLVPRLEGMLLQASNSALKGDTKSVSLLLNCYSQFVSGETQPSEMDHDDRAVLEELLRKALRARKGEGE